MSDAQIPVGLDPEGHPVPIEEALPRPNYYRCPECGDYLTVRKGEIRTSHFAHAPRTMQEHDCPLGTQSDVEELEEEYRTSDVERTEKEREIQVFLGESHGATLRLFGVLPALEWDDISDPADIRSTLEQVQITTEGVKDNLQPSWFHPSEAEVQLALDTEAEQFQVTVDSDEAFEHIDGQWMADDISVGDVFVGEPARAKRVDTSGNQTPLIKDGQWVFVIIARPPDDPSDAAKIYQLGSWTILGFETRDETKDLLAEYVDVNKTDQLGFEADILIPPNADPRSEAPVYGKPGSEALVVITPPPKADPKFEVVSVPREKGETAVIEPTGAGQPRFYRPTFPEQGSRRMSIHWTNRHRIIHLHAQDPAEVDGDQWRQDPELGISVDTGEEDVLLNPIRGLMSTTIGPDVDRDSIDACLSFDGPEGYRLDVEARFPDDADLPTVLRRGDVTFEEVLPEVPHWATEGCDRIEFQFDAAGQVEIVFQEKKPWEKNLSKEEIKERLRELDELPQKARWPLVRKVFRAPPGTPHNEFAGGQGGVKKRVRHALWEVQEERDDD